MTLPSTITSPTIVPAEILTLELTGELLPDTVVLDGRTTPIVLSDERTRGHIFVDAFRSVGFHRLRTGEQEFVFATEDAKLRLEGILTLLRFLKEHGLSWGQQLFFSNGMVVRDPRIDFVWLGSAADEIVSLAHRIAERPIRRAESRSAWRQPISGKVQLGATIAGLRRNHRALLEEHPAGKIAVAGRRYWPRRAMTRRRMVSADTVSNRRAASLLIDSLALAKGILQADPPAEARTRVLEIQLMLADSLRVFPFSKLAAQSGVLPMTPTAEEVFDERYVRTYSLHKELLAALGWNPSTVVADQFAFVAYSDQVYQAFVAVMLARAAGAKEMHRSLKPNRPSPSFASERYALYYDTIPPRGSFRNWRDDSSRPSEMKPDLTIVDQVEDRGILVDAKYRGAGGRVDTKSLNECQVYMHSFGRRRIVVCYPGPAPRLNVVAGNDNEILEVSLGPFDGLDKYLRETVWPEILSRMEPNV